MDYEEENEIVQLNLFDKVVEFFLFELDLTYNFDAWYFGQLRDVKYNIIFCESRINAVNKGKELQWNDLICKHMVHAEGPSIAPDIKSVPVYSNTKFAIKYDIKSYIGVPVFNGDDLYGTLVGLSKKVQPESILNDEKYILKISQTLSRLLTRTYDPMDMDIMKLAEKNAQIYMKTQRLVDLV